MVSVSTATLGGSGIISAPTKVDPIHVSSLSIDIVWNAECTIEQDRQADWPPYLIKEFRIGEQRMLIKIVKHRRRKRLFARDDSAPNNRKETNQPRL
jgi:hypothetical protein